MTRPVILTVDDDAQVLAAIATDLRKRYGKDYRIVRAASAAEALDALRALKEARRAGGAVVVRSAHAGPGRRGVPGRGKEACSRRPSARCLRPTPTPTPRSPPSTTSQVDYYLQKPWDPPEQQLYPIVDELLDDWRAHYRPGYGGVKVIGSRYMPTVHSDQRLPGPQPRALRVLRPRGPPTSGVRNRARWPRESTLPLVILPGGERLEAPCAWRHRAKSRAGASRPRAIFTTSRLSAPGPGGLAAAVRGASEGLKDDPDRSRGPWRAGGIFEPHRKLPRLSRRHSGIGSRAARAHAGYANSRSKSSPRSTSPACGWKRPTNTSRCPARPALHARSRARR